MPLPQDLLKLARELVDRNPAAPVEADLRRSVSTAYYHLGKKDTQPQPAAPARVALAGAAGCGSPLLALRAAGRPCWRCGLRVALAGAAGCGSPLLALRAAGRPCWRCGSILPPPPSLQSCFAGASPSVEGRSRANNLT